MHNQTNIGYEQGADYSGVRRWPRYKVSLSMRLVFHGPAGLERMYAHGRDISEGGMAMYVPTDLNLGDVATLEITVPYSEEKLLVKAAVRNREGFRYGIEFLDLDQHDRGVIAGSCQALSSLQ